MKYPHSIDHYQQELRQVKKEYDKKTKQLKKVKSLYQAEMIREDIEYLLQDKVELELIIKEIKQERKYQEVY